MKRRDVLKTAGLILGYSITGATAAAVLGGCSADPMKDGASYNPTFLNNSELESIRSIASSIIPGTETLPGAADVMIGKFMDETLSQYGTEERKTAFREGLSTFNSSFSNFGSLGEEEQLSAIRNELDNGSEFMRAFHQMTVTGFCTSERGAKEVLVFKPIPGERRGCVPFEEIGGMYAI